MEEEAEVPLDERFGLLNRDDEPGDPLELGREFGGGARPLSAVKDGVEGLLLVFGALLCVFLFGV